MSRRRSVLLKVYTDHIRRPDSTNTPQLLGFSWQSRGIVCRLLPSDGNFHSGPRLPRRRKFTRRPFSGDCAIRFVSIFRLPRSTTTATTCRRDLEVTYTKTEQGSTLTIRMWLHSALLLSLSPTTHTPDLNLHISSRRTTHILYQHQHELRTMAVRPWRRLVMGHELLHGRRSHI